jgi:hypothetical protein
MNSKVIVGGLIVILLGALWVIQPSKNSQTSSTDEQTSESTQDTQSLPRNPLEAGSTSEGTTEIQDDFKPASQKYNNAAQALEAVRKAAVDYDDILIDEFSNLKECDWCEEFYGELSKILNDQALGIDERAYYAEIMAVSGNLENIKTLVSSLESATQTEDKEMFGEALEMAMGGDDMVDYLAAYLTSENSTLRESVVSALSNQGTRLAAETLYNDLINGGGATHDYYAQGTGIAEMVPDETTIPYLHDLLIQRAPKSDAVVKALINSGIDGLTAVFDALSTEKDNAKGKEYLKNAIDHVITDEQVVDFLTKASQNQSYPEFLKEFASDALKEAQTDDLDEEEEN